MYHWYLGGLPGLSRRRTGLQIGKTSGYGPGFVDMGMGMTYWTKYGVGARVFKYQPLSSPACVKYLLS